MFQHLLRLMDDPSYQSLKVTWLDKDLFKKGFCSFDPTRRRAKKALDLPP